MKKQAIRTPDSGVKKGGMVKKPAVKLTAGVKPAATMKPGKMPSGGMVKEAGGMSPSKPLSQAGKTKSLFGKK
jgi:hypothetical protein